MTSTTIEPVNNFETNTKARRSRAVATTRTSRGRSDGYAPDRPVGRYDGRREVTRLPAGGLARPESKNLSTATAAVQDPFGDGNERILATVNRRVDILELERSHTRISEAAYRSGRLLQAVFERMGVIGGTNWAGVSRQDPMLAHELRVLRSIMSAQEIEKLMGRVRARLGMIDSRLLKDVLGDGHSFTAYAEARGRHGERGASYVATRFREALEDLSEVWSAKGLKSGPVEDKHAEAADAAPARQVTSMRKGATVARRRQEAEDAAREHNEAKPR